MASYCHFIAQLRLFVIVSSVLAVNYAFAINIAINLKNNGMNPSFDSDGSKLRAAFSTAEGLWEDYLPQSGTFPLDVWWDSGIEQAGLWERDLNPLTNDTIKINPSPGVDWFIDDSPHDNSEFDFATQRPNDVSSLSYYGGQWLYGELRAEDQLAWFTGNPPAALEIGYLGWVEDQTAPALNKIDLVSTVLHEVGHALGVRPSTAPWPVNPIWINGTPGVTINEVANPSHAGHLAAQISLMYYSGRHSTRVLPSAIDIMAAASGLGMTVIDLPRKDFLSGNLWTSASNWQGNSAPDVDDDAFVRHGGIVTLQTTTTVKNLIVDNDSTVQVTAGTLSSLLGFGVNSTFTVGMSAPTEKSLLDLRGGKLNTNKVIIGDETGSVGKVRVGPASSWESFQAWAGLSGTGSIAIEGGSFESYYLILGEEPTAAGSLHLTQSSGQSKVRVREQFYIGRQGTGAVIHDSGELSAYLMYISNFGTYELHGGIAGSTQLVISGSGSLSITGGTFNSGNTFLESGDALKEARVTVDGPASKWITARLFVGNGGGLPVERYPNKGSISITGGADFVTLLDANVGKFGGIGNVTVDGVGSRWEISEWLELHGSGVLMISNGGTVVTDVGMVRTNSLSLGAPRLIVDGLNSAFIAKTLNIWERGMVKVNDGGKVVADEIAITNRGILSGDGNVIGNVANSGLVSPGQSTGSLKVNGDFTQTADGELHIELAFLSDYDRLDVAGSASLDGTLRISIADGYFPSIGNSFSFLSAMTGVSGSFSKTVLPNLPSNLTWNLLYGGANVALIVQSTGDYNANAVVDAADYAIWRETLGQIGPGLMADGNGNGIVDLADYDVWRRNFGKVVSVNAAFTTIPEPSTLCLLTSCGFLSRFFRCSRARAACRVLADRASSLENQRPNTCRLR